MVKKIRRELGTWQGKLILVLLIIFSFSATFFAMSTLTQAESIVQPVRVIELEIKNMVFGKNNPDIYLLRGESVRFIITNLDPGMTHEFAIKGTGIKTRALKYGDQDTILFQTPQEEIDLVYVCTWHAIMMRGNLLVRSAIPTDLNIASN